MNKKEAWKSIISLEYPGRTDYEYEIIFDMAATDYGMGRNTNIADIYCKFQTYKVLVSDDL